MDAGCAEPLRCGDPVAWRCGWYLLAILVKEMSCSMWLGATEKLLWHGGNSMARTSRTTGEHPAGCSKSPDFSPAQPWRAETRLSQARPQRTIPFIWGGWDDPNCARPTRAFSSCALREQGDRPSYPTSFFSILLGIGSGSRQASLLRETQHEVHGLNGLACGTFYKIIQRGHRND